MPFKPPYKSEYSPGDIIYGFDDTRTHYINTHPSFMSASPVLGALIEQYAVMRNELRYITDLPCYQNEFLQAVKDHPKYKSAYNGAGFLIRGDKGRYQFLEHPNDNIRKCKAALYWAAQKQQLHIHFLLDDIDFEKVVSKSSSQDHTFPSVNDYLKAKAKEARMRNVRLTSYNPYVGAVEFKSTTGCELRWIYRNRNNLKVQKTIQFWYKAKPCCPPWEKAFDQYYGKPIAYQWFRYTPKRDKAAQIIQENALSSLSKLFDLS